MTPDPFPHFAMQWFSVEWLRLIHAEIPDRTHSGWRQFGNDRELKLEGGPALWGPNTSAFFSELRALAPGLERAFGLPPLTMETVGGGYHLIPPGGYLHVHTDFSRSPSTQRFRRLNVLTYLNDDWGDDDGGELELWDDTGPVVKIKPEMGTTVAFITSATSWHGHPNPTKRWRASLAAYFFSDDPPPGFREQSTVWHPNGGHHA